MSDTPALDKRQEAIDNGSQQIGDFLVWLNSRGYTIAEVYKNSRGEEDIEIGLVPIAKNRDQLIADFFGVDLEACNRVLEAILEALRGLNERVAAEPCRDKADCTHDEVGATVDPTPQHVPNCAECGGLLTRVGSYDSRYVCTNYHRSIGPRLAPDRSTMYLDPEDEAWVGGLGAKDNQ